MVHLQDRTRYVSNPDQILSASTVSSIDNILYALEQRTGIETLVVAVKEIEGGDCFEFALQLGKQNGVGKKQTDNGLVILLVTEERCIQFVTGYGLEGILPDAICKRIQNRFMNTPFSQGDWDNGMLAGIQAIDSYLNGLLAPVMQLDLFTQKLDDLLLETRCKTREEMMVLLREEIAKTQLAEALLKKLQAQQQADLQKNRRKAPLTLADKVMIINKAFKSLEDIGAKHSFTQRTIQNWDNGKCPYDGYSPLFNELELLAWANKKVGEIRSKQALSNLVRGMSEDEMSRRAGKR